MIIPVLISSGLMFIILLIALVALAFVVRHLAARTITPNAPNALSITQMLDISIPLSVALFKLMKESPIAGVRELTKKREMITGEMAFDLMVKSGMDIKSLCKLTDEDRKAVCERVAEAIPMLVCAP